jgi:hypothetical protein
MSPSYIVYEIFAEVAVNSLPIKRQTLAIGTIKINVVGVVKLVCRNAESNLKNASTPCHKKSFRTI